MNYWAVSSCLKFFKWFQLDLNCESTTLSVWACHTIYNVVQYSDLYFWDRSRSVPCYLRVLVSTSHPLSSIKEIAKIKVMTFRKNCTDHPFSSSIEIASWILDLLCSEKEHGKRYIFNQTEINLKNGFFFFFYLSRCD